MKILIYSANSADRTVRHTWTAGAFALGLFKRFDKTFAVESLEDLIKTFESLKSDKIKITELQFWGHGACGRFYVGNEYISTHRKLLVAVGSDDLIKSDLTIRLRNSLKNLFAPKSLFWLRTCASFGGQWGIDLAEALSVATKAKVAAHIYSIGLVHSGLQTLEYGEKAAWAPNLGYEIIDEMIHSEGSSLMIKGSFMFWKMTL